jgi:uncharacterized protein
MAAWDEHDWHEYRLRIKQWRQEREDALRSPDGWLSLAGLHMLDPGPYRLGSAEDNDIVLPPGAPEHWATLNYQAGQAMLQVTGDAPALVDQIPLSSLQMVDNGNGRRATVVQTGPISINLHRFGDHVALRVRDRTSEAIREFDGCSWFEIDPTYRVVGKLQRQQVPSMIQVATSIDTLAEYPSVGAVEFALQGQPLSLLASATSTRAEVMLIFKDATAGRETYGAGRYLYAPVDEDGQVELDFNKAYNPPCVFTHYATCSLPPAANTLPVPILAGERYVAKSDT